MFPRLHLHRRTARGIGRGGGGDIGDAPASRKGEEEVNIVGQEGGGAEGQDTLEDLVITYEDFLGFLAKKHSCIQQTCLGFKGRNAVLHLFEYADTLV